MSLRKNLSRRDTLRLLALGAGSAALSACGGGQAETPTALAAASATPPPLPATATRVPPTETPAQPASLPIRQLAARFVHISDMHVQPEGIAQERFSRAMRQVLSLDPPVEFVVNAGDCVMDALYASKARAEAQWDTFRSVISADFPLPVYHAIGNHDVWGWGLSAEERAKVQDDPLFAKEMALQRLGLAKRYYAFNHGGWRFIVLDSAHLADTVFDHPYTGKLDGEQLEWLLRELKFTPANTPICIISHIPIFGASGLMASDESSGNWVMPGAWQHIDGRELLDLFWEHPNVKLCLSGHTHDVEELSYHGVKYLTNGAISGNWWNGAYHNIPPGYVVFNLYDDGSSESEFVTY